jgi:hypothetical protein
MNELAVIGIRKEEQADGSVYLRTQFFETCSSPNRHSLFPAKFSPYQRASRKRKNMRSQARFEGLLDQSV